MSRRGTFLTVALAISLLANAFTAGFFVMRWADAPDRRLKRLAWMAGVGRAPPEVREHIDAQLVMDMEAIRAAFDEVRAARQTVRQAMRAEPFDAAALDTAFAGLRTASSRLQETVHRSVADAVAAAPADVRSKIEDRSGRRQ